MSDQFASLVGHQNTRQKIRYVKKIRDENAALKMVCVLYICVLEREM